MLLFDLLLLLDVRLLLLNVRLLLLDVRLLLFDARLLLLNVRRVLFDARLLLDVFLRLLDAFLLFRDSISGSGCSIIIEISLYPSSKFCLFSVLYIVDKRLESVTLYVPEYVSILPDEQCFICLECFLGIFFFFKDCCPKGREFFGFITSSCQALPALLRVCFNGLSEHFSTCSFKENKLIFDILQRAVAMEFFAVTLD